jgi:hypothetical protein
MIEHVVLILENNFIEVRKQNVRLKLTCSNNDLIIGTNFEVRQFIVGRA